MAEQESSFLYVNEEITLDTARKPRLYWGPPDFRFSGRGEFERSVFLQRLAACIDPL